MPFLLYIASSCYNAVVLIVISRSFLQFSLFKENFGRISFKLTHKVVWIVSTVKV